MEMDTENRAVACKKSISRSGIILSNVRSTIAAATNPVHEEYLLQAAREQFKKDTQVFFNKVLLRDLEESKNLELLKINKNELRLKHSKDLLEYLSEHRKEFNEREYIFLAKSRHEVRNLHKDCRSIKEELTQCRETIDALFLNEK